MAGVTQFDRPAQMNIMNTYVPLNVGLLMGAVDKKRQAYQQSLAAIGETESMLDALNAIPGSVDEATLNTARQKAKGVIDEFGDRDLSDPFVIKELHSKISGVADSALLNKINESYKNYMTGMDYRARMGDKYNALLDQDDWSSWDSSKGVYNFNPSKVPTYVPKEQYLDKYFSQISKPRVLLEQGHDPYGRYLRGRTQGDVNKVIGSYANEYAASPSGQNEIKLWRMANPDDDRSELAIAKDILNEYGQRYVGISDFTPMTVSRTRGGTGSTKQQQPLVPYNPGYKNASEPGAADYKAVKGELKDLESKRDDLQPGTPEYNRVNNQIRDLEASMSRMNQYTKEEEQKFRKEAEEAELKAAADVAWRSGLYGSADEAYKDFVESTKGMTDTEKARRMNSISGAIWQPVKSGVVGLANMLNRGLLAPGDFIQSFVNDAYYDDQAGGEDNMTRKEHYQKIRENRRSMEPDAAYGSKDEFINHALRRQLFATEGYSNPSMWSRRKQYRNEFAPNVATENLSTYTAADLGMDQIGNLNYVTSPDGEKVVKSPWAAYAGEIKKNPSNFKIIQDKYNKDTKFNEYLQDLYVEITGSNMVMDPAGTISGSTTPKIEFTYVKNDDKGKPEETGTFMVDVANMNSNMLQDLKNTMYAQGRNQEVYHIEASTEERIPDKLYESEITNDKPLYIESRYIPYAVDKDKEGNPITVPWTYKVVPSTTPGEYKLLEGYRFGGKDYFEEVTDGVTGQPAEGSRNDILAYILQSYGRVRSQLDAAAQVAGGTDASW